MHMTTRMTDREPLLSDDDLSDIAPKGTLRQWRYRGCGPVYIKVNGKVRYRRSDVEAWLDANTITPGAA